MDNNYPNELLKFEIRMFNFKGKSLPEDKVIKFFIKKELKNNHLIERFCF